MSWLLREEEGDRHDPRHLSPQQKQQKQPRLPDPTSPRQSARARVRASFGHNLEGSVPRKRLGLRLRLGLRQPPIKPKLKLELELQLELEARHILLSHRSGPEILLR